MGANNLSDAEAMKIIDLQAAKIRFLLKRITDGTPHIGILSEFITRCDDNQNFGDF